MKSLDLTPEQKPTYDKLLSMVEVIEKRLRLEIDQTESEQLLHEINHRQQLNADSSKIMEYATIIYDSMQGLAAEQMLLNAEAMEAPAAIRTMLLKGKLAKWSALYERSVEACKTLDKSIEGLRSMLSYNKELISNKVFHEG